MDIGECSAIHDLALRADYEKASETKDYGYQVDVDCIHIIRLFMLTAVSVVFENRRWII